MTVINNLKDIRRQNLNLLLTSLGGHGSQKRLAEQSGIYHTHISNLRMGNKEMGEEIARRIEGAMKLANGWMDRPHSGIHEDEESFTKATLEEAVMKERLLALWAQLSGDRQQVALNVLTDMALAEHCRSFHQAPPLPVE